MAIFNSYVSLPEGINYHQLMVGFPCGGPMANGPRWPQRLKLSTRSNHRLMQGLKVPESVALWWSFCSWTAVDIVVTYTQRDIEISEFSRLSRSSNGSNSITISEFSRFSRSSNGSNSITISSRLFSGPARHDVVRTLCLYEMRSTVVNSMTLETIWECP